MKIEVESISILFRMGRLSLVRKEIRISDVSIVWEYLFLEMKKIATVEIKTSNVKPILRVIGLLYN